ncbi:MAG: GNAT family N-acetyltransferase [Clostridiales bacterium]|nr:GNAT family N-acetyltransferase [Clostridiales bacterium]
MPRLTEQQIAALTHEFYSCFVGTNVSEAPPGVSLVCTDARNEPMKGLGCKYSIYALVKDEKCIVAYAPHYAAFFEKLRGKNTADVLTCLEASFTITKVQLMSFRQECVREYGSAQILKKEDYPLYEAFFCTAHPTASPSSWLREYFEEKTTREYFTGFVRDGQLVSVCDAPDMPYLAHRVQHTGILTLPEARRKGYARCTAALAAHHLIERGICPQWECRITNTASIALAESIGYEKYGIAYILKE